MCESNWMLLALLRQYVRPYRWLLTVVAVLQVISTLASLYLPTVNAAIIDDGVTGVLVGPSRPAELAAVLDALAGAPSTRSAMGTAARELALARSWDSVLDRIIDGSTP